MEKNERDNPGVVINIVDGCTQGIYDGERVIQHANVNGYQIQQFVPGPAIAEFDYSSIDLGKGAGIPIDEVNKILKERTGITFSDNKLARETFRKLGNQTISVGKDGNIDFRNHPEYSVIDMGSKRSLTPEQVSNLIKEGELRIDQIIDEQRKREILSERAEANKNSYIR